MPHPSSNQEKLLGALTLACMQRLGDAALLIDAEDRPTKERRCASAMWPLVR